MPTNEPHRITLGTQTFGPGTHRWRIPVTTDLDDSHIELINTVVVGERPGPTIFVTSTLHGIEWLSIEVVKRLTEATDPKALKGTLIGLPVANQPAFGRLSRNTPDHSDNADLNRVFPGAESWITEQLASTIVREILPHASAVVDFHFGSWGHAMGSITYGSDFPNRSVVETSRKMALAFGWPLVRSGAISTKFPGPRSLVGYAGTVLELPCLIGGVGGAGFGRDVEESWITTNVQGTLNAMKALDMFDEPPPEPTRFLDFQMMRRTNPKVAGMFHPVHARETLGREVAEGEVLGHVISPYSFEVREELRAPCDGWLMYIARWQPVRPGDWAFGVIDKHHEATRWTEA